MRSPIKFALVTSTVGIASALGIGAILAQLHAGATTTATPATIAAPAESRPSAPMHRYVMTRGGAYGYATALSDEDRAKGRGAVPLMMVTYNGIVNGDYSFTSYSATGNMIVMRCSEPCAYMNVMNYDHAMPETYPVAPGTVLEAMVLDARGGFLRP